MTNGARAVESDAPERGAVTWRSVVFGLAGAVLVNAWPTWSCYVVRSSWADFGQLTIAVLLPYILFVGIVNEALRRLSGRLALSRAEVLVVFMIGMVAATMQGEGLTGYFLGVVTAPGYFASPENEWGELILTYAPRRLLVGNHTPALRYFYEGLPSGQRMPWGAFLVPVVCWASFFVGLYLLCCFVAILLRKQWVEHERLAYPMAEIPMILADRSQRRGWLPDVAHGRLFWVGVAVPLGIICWNMLSWWFPGFPRLPWLAGFLRFPMIPIGRGFPAFHGKVDFFVVGFAFLTSTEILFSLWFFHMLSILQMGMLNRMGFSIGPADPWCSWDAATGWQSLGGFLVFVLWGLWMARRHLGAVVRKAVTGGGDLDDSDELVSYRTAFFGSIVCFVYCVAWFTRAGMTWPVAGAFMGILLFGYVGLAKISAMSGLVYLRGPVTAQACVWHIFGTANLSPPAMVGIGLTHTFFCDAKGWIMAPFVHVARIAKSPAMAGKSRKGIFSWIGVGSLLGAAVAIAMVLTLGGRVGAYHFGAATFQWSHISIWHTVATRVKAGLLEPTGPHGARLAFAGVGAAIMTGLVYMRTHFAWWPLHPVGFAISSSYPIRDSVLGVFLVWLTKVVLFRLGGLELYRKAIPLFVGLLVGYVLGIGLGFVVDCIWFPGAGHALHGF